MTADKDVDLLKDWTPQQVNDWLDHQPPEFKDEIRRLLKVRGPESIIEAVKELRRKATAPSLSQQEREDAAWVLKHTGFDDESLQTEDD